MELMDVAQYHLKRMDLVVRASEIRWGMFGALEQLVPPELAAKFQTQWQKLTAAVMESRHEDVCVLADGVIRGIWALENRAIIDGHTPLNLSPIGLVVVSIPEEKSEYVPSGKPMNDRLDDI